MTTYRRPTIFINGVQRLVSRVVMERHLGRPLLTSEIVHHRDGDPFNNDISNLQVVSRAEHKRIHGDVGVATRLQKRWGELDAASIVSRFEHESASAIARSIGCSYKTITRILRQAGVVGELPRHRRVA